MPSALDAATNLPFVRIFALLASALWAVALVMNFVLLFKNELAVLQERQLQDAWLLRQCEDPVFAARMQSFDDPCGQARHRGQLNVHMLAFHYSLDKLYLCGSYSCEGLVWLFVERVRSNLVLFLVIVAVVLVSLPMMVLPLWRKWTDHLAESHIRANFNMPYGFNSALVYNSAFAGGGDGGGYMATPMYAHQHPGAYSSARHASARGGAFPQQRVITAAAYE